MLVGYCRTSTIDQLAGFEAQRRDLEAAGCERVFAEQTSSIGKRDELAEALAFVRAGDVFFVVTRLDRLARSVADLTRIVQQLEGKGVSLKIIGMGIDTSTSNGKLMLNVLGAVAQFEREVMLERQREGIQKAKGEGRYTGRKPTARAKSPQIIALAEKGLAKERIAKELGVGVASVYRVLAAAAAA
jgi:DNA invertase Pin-like site-specific DNA recombinase